VKLEFVKKNSRNYDGNSLCVHMKTYDGNSLCVHMKTVLGVKGLLN